VLVRVFRDDHEPRWEITMAPLPIKASESSPFVFNSPTSFASLSSDAKHTVEISVDLGVAPRHTLDHEFRLTEAGM